MYVRTEGGLKSRKNMIGCVKSVQEGKGSKKKAEKSAHALNGCCLS